MKFLSVKQLTTAILLASAIAHVSAGPLLDQLRAWTTPGSEMPDIKAHRGVYVTSKDEWSAQQNKKA